MKNKAGFWIMIGANVAIAITIASKNIQAGIFIGTGSAWLLMIITNLEVDRKIRN